MSECPGYQLIESIRFPKHFNAENIGFALNYLPQNSDRFVVTFPKSGTTWTQLIINLIIDNDINTEFMRNSFLEFSGRHVVRWPVIKTHLPFHSLPYNRCAKYLCVFRNPKDVCVSYYYHTLKTDPQFRGDFHQFFDNWFNGRTPYGDYFEHTLNYWSHRFDDNFHYIIYEQMKDRPKESVLKIAEFLDQEFVDKLNENNELFLNKVIENSSFESMSCEPNKYRFWIRKGIVGDWRSHLTEDESHLIDGRVETMFSGTGIEKLWSFSMK